MNSLVCLYVRQRGLCEPPPSAPTSIYQVNATNRTNLETKPSFTRVLFSFLFPGGENPCLVFPFDATLRLLKKELDVPSCLVKEIL